MSDRYVTCPFCGFEFAREDTLCEHGCPLGATCRLIRCPSCQYEYPERPQSITWIGRLLRRRAREAAISPEGVTALVRLRPGSRAVIVSLDGAHPARRNSLAVFGLVPGADLTVIQQRPATVVRAGETELALDPEIAAEIVVRRVPESAAAR